MTHFLFHHKSSQQSSSNTQTTNTVQFQTTTPTTQPIVQSLAYIPAQITQSQNIQTGVTINILHCNAIPNYTTSRNLSDFMTSITTYSD